MQKSKKFAQDINNQLMSFLLGTLPPDYQYKTKIAIVIDLCLLVLLGLLFIN